MTNQLFQTEEEKQDAITIFERGVEQPFWKLLVKVLEVNIKTISHLILEGLNLKGEIATQEETNRLRDKLKAYKELKNAPYQLVEKLQSPAQEPINLDPYYTTKELKKLRS